jgi:hypothetical protein
MLQLICIGSLLCLVDMQECRNKGGIRRQHFDDIRHKFISDRFPGFAVMSILNYGTVYSCWWTPKFRRNILPPSSRWMLRVEAECSSKTLAYMYKIMRCHSSEDNLNNRHCFACNLFLYYACCGMWMYVTCMSEG